MTIINVSNILALKFKKQIDAIETIVKNLFKQVVHFILGWIHLI